TMRSRRSRARPPTARGPTSSTSGSTTSRRGSPPARTSDSGSRERGGRMKLLANLFVALVAVAHLWFLTLEMFLWTSPIGLRTFQMTAEVAASSAVLAANQGLYNGFLAAGLMWGLVARDGAFAIKVFFLS